MNWRVAPAALDWRGDQPFSTTFGDIYHAPDARAEVERVFLVPSGIPRGKPTAHGFRIGELGFGTGLNFVVAAAALRRAGEQLSFTSFEAAPIAAEAFRALARRRAAHHPELADLYRELAEVYPPLLSGWHQRRLANGRVHLHLFYGDAGAGLSSLVERSQPACVAPMHAWFLDGFAPDRNPELWSPEVINAIARLSSRGTTVATFTAAGRVRRALAAEGFSMRRVDQRPHKRESLAGEFVGADRAVSSVPGRVRILGAGLAGASVARQLAERGVAVTLYDQRLGGEVFEMMRQPALQSATVPPAQEAAGSTLPATVLHGRLLADASSLGAFRAYAYLHAAAFARGFAGFHATGVLQTLPSARDNDFDTEDARLRTIAACWAPDDDWLRVESPSAASARAGWPVSRPALWFPQGGIVSTPAFVRALIDHPLIATVPEDLPLPGQPGGPLPDSTSPVVLACGMRVLDAPAAAHLELAAVPGQIDRVQTAAVPRLPLVGEGYLVPHQGFLFAGSTYEYRPWEPGAATRSNLAQLAHRPWRPIGAFRGERATTSDRLPLIGPLDQPDESPIPGLWITSGHGSMGNVTSHLAGAVISAALSGHPPPVSDDLSAALLPARFRARQARRGIRHRG
ncbi:MAG: tRNA (5-methylaminomethyl-2-thiouridine)(34)-methyltransferase MnmD [Pseudomonadales bacterium]